MPCPVESGLLSGFDPLVQEWFSSRFSLITEPQEQGWPEIQAGRDVLISAPTGSGKTLAAFLTAIDRLVRQARSGTLSDQTEVVYVSPLKALSNDVHKNLEIPLAGIAECAQRIGLVLPSIRTAVRTGDTPAADRQRMTKEAPHILVTTPESLFILLTAEGPRKMLSSVRTLIVDEIHAVADDKRGSHLALSIARLEALTKSSIQKIGLSATVSPIEEVAKFLSSKAATVQVGHRRVMDLAVEVPRDELTAVASTESWGEIYDRIASLIQQNRTTLVFVNTRKLSERVAHNLTSRLAAAGLGEAAVLPHHGSLSRGLRLEAERRLKSGDLKAVVATASLELGIDIGTVDLVCQIGTPRSIAVALQRAGRAGHWVGAVPKARFFATTRDELIEISALIRAIRNGAMDRLEIPSAPLDILAQQLVAACACEEFSEDDLFALARSAYPYRALPRTDFDQILEMLAEGIATSRGRGGAYLHRDQVNGKVRGRRGARLASITSGGAIPDTTQYQVIAAPDETVVGTLDEDFAVESNVGDVFLLGTTSWRIRRVEPGRVRVENAKGAAPSVPFWLGEAPGRTRELSREVSTLREEISESHSPLALLEEQCGLDPRGAEQAIAYIRAGQIALGIVPSQTAIVAERFFDEAGGMQLVIHSPFGARINKAWGLALRKRFCRTFNFELQAAATDNGIVISLSELHSFPLESVFAFLNPATVTHVLTQATLDSPMFGSRWKWNSSRALAVPRFSGGRKIPPPIQRMRSNDLLASVFPDQVACAENLTGEIRIPDHPLVKETIANCLHEAMDLDGLIEVLNGIADGTRKTVAIDTREPSPLCHEILNANPYAFLDDAPIEERRTMAVQLRRTLSPEDAQNLATLSPAAIAQVAAEAWPVVRDEHELHDALLTLIILPPVAEWQVHFEALRIANRASMLNGHWVAAERRQVAGSLPSEPAMLAVVRGWLDSIGPVTSAGLAARLSLPLHSVDIALAALEAEGVILRGRFTSQETEFCHRRILSRIHRLTLGHLRREIEPVTAADFMRFLTRWQHASPSTRLHGVDGLFQIIRQLQGYEISAAAWESDILPSRIAKYEPELLERLCLSGEIMWGRLSPHPALETPSGRRVRPTRIAPLAIFLREDAQRLLPAASDRTPHLSHSAQDILAALQARGALFFNELLRSTGRLPSEVEDGLWELVAAGFVTADGFENLRALIDPKRRKGEGRGRSARPRHSAGRWALLDRSHTTSNVEFLAQQFLARWGVVFRDMLIREPLAPAWRDLLQIYRRMEARGEIRGGRFVSGFVGEQFARPEALDLLRHLRRSEKVKEEIWISPADPLNQTGVVLPGARTGALAQGRLRLVDGIPDDRVA